MTATEEPRTVLDERGVNWHLLNTEEKACDDDYDTAIDGKRYLLEQWGRYLTVLGLTPAQAVTAIQAITAILGSETCDNAQRIKRLETENEKLRSIAKEMGTTMYRLGIEYCAMCPRHTYNDPCIFLITECGECRYKRELRELGIEVDE